MPAISKNYDKLKGEYESADKSAATVESASRTWIRLRETFSRNGRKCPIFQSHLCVNSRRQLNETRTKFVPATFRVGQIRRGEHGASAQNSSRSRCFTSSTT